jgi:hypothetical protein
VAEITDGFQGQRESIGGRKEKDEGLVLQSTTGKIKVDVQGAETGLRAPYQAAAPYPPTSTLRNTATDQSEIPK